MSWNLDSYAPATEAEQAEREIVEEIVRNERPTRTVSPYDDRADIGCGGCDNDEHCGGCGCCTTPVCTTPVRFKRLRSGAWGVCGPSALLQPGATVDVEKRNGDVDAVVVGTVVWANDTRAYATIRRGGN